MASLSLGYNIEVLQICYHSLDVFNLVTLQYKEPNSCDLNKIQSSMINKEQHVIQKELSIKISMIAHPLPNLICVLLFLICSFVSYTPSLCSGHAKKAKFLPTCICEH